MTEQNPNSDLAALRNLALLMNLPLNTPSTSIPATLTLLSSFNNSTSSANDLGALGVGMADMQGNGTTDGRVR